MRRPGWIWPLLACAAVVLAAGIPYWRLSYEQVNRGEVNLLPGAILLGGLTLILVIAEAARAKQIAIAMLACAPLIDIVSIARHTARDPTSHNLWPIELVLAAIAGAAVVMPALLLGFAMRWVLKRVQR